MDKTLFVFVLTGDYDVVARVFATSEAAIAAALAEVQDWWEAAGLDEEERMEQRRAFDRDVVNGGYADPNNDSGAVVLVQTAMVEE